MDTFEMLVLRRMIAREMAAQFNALHKRLDAVERRLDEVVEEVNTHTTSEADETRDTVTDRIPADAFEDGQGRWTDDERDSGETVRSAVREVLSGCRFNVEVD